MIKQVIAIRKDLNMRKGKMVAQGAHASMKVFFDRAGGVITSRKPIANDCMNGPSFVEKYRIEVSLTDKMKEWYEGIFAKVVVGVDSEDALLALAHKAHEAGIPYAVIEDAGRTEFHGEKTRTAVAIGPDDPDKIDKITGDLKLL